AALAAATRPAPPAGTVYTTNREYDAASRLTKEISPQIDVFDPNTQVTSQIRPTTTYTYDGVGNRLTRTVGAGTSQAVTEYFAYDPANHLGMYVNANRVLH